ncbi:EAL domain-containing protein [Clostridium sp. HCP1S3_B4]|uniref:putative bifunctional diguanylate cyclase/phosphodiesterase n=1 Tax=unclassified Clostridium TaxID=2614128 RepID=UPI002A79AA03|nr:bifunctional diguanylate cyclase/phosphodiesterase [Clostridiales bacterium]MDY2729156.1 bifunctional diguanylate cyclase/phosphodiesterase [Clostridium sp.]
MDENLAYLRFENLNSNNLNNDEINKLYRGCLEFSKDNLIICNIESETIQIMGNMAKVLNSEKRDSVKFTLEEFSNIIYDDMNGDEIFNIWNKIIQRNKDVRLEFKLKDINNRTICVNVKLRAFYDEMGYVQFYFGLIHDVTRERRAEEELKNIVDFDVVTNLPSSTYTKRTIDNYLKISQKENESCALVLVNIDNFKYINDTYGHEDGDRILKKVAIRLSKIIEAGDLICRYSGDEFIIFRHGIESFNEAKDLAILLRKSFEEGIKLNGNEIFITVSIGVALSPDNGSNYNILLKNADTALYRAKNDGKDEIQFFDNSISTEIDRVYAIEKGLRTAISDNELYVVFQPKVVLQDSTVNGFEALLRWKSKELGNVSPMEFIPVAESTRMIIPIGRFVLEEVFKKVKNLLNEGHDDFKVAVNFSEVQFRYSNIIDDFKTFIKKYNVPSKYIEVEITESMLMKTCDENIEQLNKIKSLGISVALDDFGTGYSSFNYLTKLPIDVLKIDRSFVIDLLNDKKSRCIVEAIIELSHELGINVVAEGVEEEKQVEYLKGILCDVVQGYYYSKPDEFNNVKKLLGRKL